MDAQRSARAPDHALDLGCALCIARCNLHPFAQRARIFVAAEGVLFVRNGLPPRGLVHRSIIVNAAILHRGCLLDWRVRAEPDAHAFRGQKKKTVCFCYCAGSDHLRRWPENYPVPSLILGPLAAEVGFLVCLGVFFNPCGLSNSDRATVSAKARMYPSQRCRANICKCAGSRPLTRGRLARAGQLHPRIIQKAPVHRKQPY